MIDNNKVSNIPCRLHNVGEGGVAGADEVIDDKSGLTLEELVGNKDYTPAAYSGMGRVVLKKNMVNGVNTLTQDMFYKGGVGNRVPNTNTIYIIRYDYTLKENITIPANCVLQFDGGSLNNGILQLSSNCCIKGLKETVLKSVLIHAIGTEVDKIENIQIKNVVFDGENNPSVNLIRFVYCDNISIDNVTIQDYYPDAESGSGRIIEDGTVGLINYCSNITITNSKILNCSQEGFSIFNSSNITIDNIDVDDTDALSAEWSSINVMRSLFVFVTNSRFNHKRSNPVSGSTVNFSVKHGVIDNCNFIGGNGVDIGDELYAVYEGIFDVEDVSIKSCYFKTARGAIHSTNSSAIERDIRIADCVIDAYYENEGSVTHSTAFQLTNCINFIADNCVINTGHLTKFFVTKVDDEQEHDGLGNYIINNCVFQQNSDPSEILNFGTNGVFTDIIIKNTKLILYNRNKVVLAHGILGGNIVLENNIIDTPTGLHFINTGYVDSLNIQNNVIKSRYTDVANYNRGISVSDKFGTFIFKSNILSNISIFIQTEDEISCINPKFIEENVFFENCHIYVYNPIQNVNIVNNNGLSTTEARIYANSAELNSNNIIAGNVFRVGINGAGTVATENKIKATLAVNNNIIWEYRRYISGTLDNIPPVRYSGQPYFCTNMEVSGGVNVARPLTFDNVKKKWITADGVSTDVNRQGMLGSRPSSDKIYAGFRYLATDRVIDTNPDSPTYLQIIYKSNGGLEIIHKGNDVWVDALGRTVS